METQSSTIVTPSEKSLARKNRQTLRCEMLEQGSIHHLRTILPELLRSNPADHLVRDMLEQVSKPDVQYSTYPSNTSH